MSCGGASDELKKATSKVTLLDAKRSTSVGIVMKAITDALQGKELRDALMEIDENLLPLDVLTKLLQITPTPEEAKLIEDRMLLSFLFPAQNKTLLEQLQKVLGWILPFDHSYLLSQHLHF